jgi:hypothetical protein
MMPVDNLWMTRPKRAQIIHIFASYLTSPLPSSSASERVCAVSSLRRRSVWGVLCLFVGSICLQMQPAQANTIDHYKLYAHSRIIQWNEFMCFKDIITKESRWNVNAKNGSHYGLGQMRSKWYRNLDGYRQIDASIKYINARYGSMCKAWEFHKKRNYY